MPSTLVALLIFFALLFGGSIGFVMFAVMTMAKGSKRDQWRSDQAQIDYLKDWHERQEKRRGR